MSVSTLSLTDAVSVINAASAEELDRILEAVNMRRKVLQFERSLGVTVGATGVLTGLSPKYINGLSGTVKAVKGNIADFALDAASTNTLRITRRSRFYIPADVTSHVIRVPLSCVDVNG